MDFAFRLKIANSTRSTDRKFKFNQKTFSEKHIKDKSHPESFLPEEMKDENSTDNVESVS